LNQSQELHAEISNHFGSIDFHLEFLKFFFIKNSRKSGKKKHYSRIRRHPLSKRLIKDRIFTAIIYKNLIGDKLEKSNLIF
jgi:hypothetical protein